MLLEKPEVLENLETGPCAGWLKGNEKETRQLGGIRFTAAIAIGHEQWGSGSVGHTAVLGRSQIRQHAIDAVELVKQVLLLNMIVLPFLWVTWAASSISFPN